MSGDFPFFPPKGSWEPVTEPTVVDYKKQIAIHKEIIKDFIKEEIYQMMWEYAYDKTKEEIENIAEQTYQELIEARTEERETQK